MKRILAAGTLLLLATAAAAAPVAQADAPRKVAALSLIGDRLLVVGSQMQTGTRIDRNQKDILALGTDELDTATVLEFERLAKLRSPNLEVVLLRARDKAVHELQDAVVEGKRDQRELLSAVAPLARRAGATHLVLFTKSRGEAQIRVEDGSIGNGYVDGLGFYIDRWSRTRKTQEGQADVGILAPFAYFKAVLVELEGLKVISEETSHQARALYAKNINEAQDPWNYLTPPEKVQALKALSGEGVQKVVPKVLGRL